MPRDVKKQAAEITEALETAKPRRPAIPDDAWLSLAHPVLNCAVSGRAHAGIAKGMFLWFVGGSSSAKSWTALQILAEAANNPNFKDHRLVYDPTENGAMMDKAEYFGGRLASRIEPLRGTRRRPKFSETVEEFYYGTDDLFRDGRPFIEVLDSMDALDARDDYDKFSKQKSAASGGDDVKGSYGMAKAKANSNNLRRVVSRLAKSGSILIIISQTRDKVANTPFPMETVAGGRALKFYCHVNLWTKVKRDLSRTVLGKKREYGKVIQVDVQKNRVSGWEGRLLVPFLRKHGFDEIGGSVDYLVEEGHWNGSRNKDGTLTSVKAPEFRFDGRPEKLIESIGGDPKARERVIALVETVWRKIDDATTIKRPQRYA